MRLHVALAVLLGWIVLAAGLPWWAALGASGAVLGWGAVRACRAWRERRRLRSTADRLLLWGAQPQASAELIARRVDELVAPRRRKTLARSLRSIVREVEGRVLPGPVPLNRRDIRAQLELVQALETRLADLSLPVAPRGVLLVERLLTEPGSPLYSGAHGQELGARLAEAHAALDDRSPQPRHRSGRLDPAPRSARPNHLNLLGGR